MKLRDYTAIALYVLGKVSNVGAQVIYTDIDPDIVLDEDLEFGYVNIDNLYDDEFGFVNFSYTFTTSIFYDQTFQKILVGPLDTIEGAIAGTTGNIGFGIIYFPYALQEGDLIDQNLSWQNWYLQRMAHRTYTYPGTEYILDKGGFWYPEVLDHYLGIRFKDDESQTHYGWIRCDVKDEGRTLVIKDYAYEIQPDNPILAGDTIHYIPVQETENTFDAIVYSFGKTIFIKTNEQKLSLKIFDVTGKEIHSEEIQNAAQVNMQKVSAGIYIVQLQDDNKVYRKKITLK